MIESKQENKKGEKIYTSDIKNLILELDKNIKKINK